MKLFPDNIKDAQPDPYIFERGGKFYIYATGGDGVQVYSSSSLFGGYVREQDVCKISGFNRYWAPSVIELDGVFYLYVSCMPENSEDTHEQAMRVFTATSPTGPFEDKGQILSPFSIDSHIVKNESGLFLFYSTNDYEAKMGGTHIVVDRMLDPYTPEGKPKKVITASLEEELWEPKKSPDDKGWYTVEGAFYFRRGDYHFVLYSGSCFLNECYFVGYSYAKTDECDLTKINFKKYPGNDVYKPLLRRNEFEEGTGHNSIIEYKGELYAVYHARDIGKRDESYSEASATYDNDFRDARICKLHIDGEKIIAERYVDRI